MKNKAALLLLIGLVCAPVVYAQTEEPQAPAATAPPEGQTKTKKTKAGHDYITLNFTNIDISALVKVMSELTQRNFILDERVVGKITLMTPTKISPDEAYQVFLSALEIKGFTAMEDGKITRIIPAASARQSGLKVLQDGELAGEGFVTKLIRMNFVNPQEIVRTIMPLVTKDGSLIAYPATNSLIVTDAVSNIRKIESLIRAMDVAAPEGKGKINVYYLRNASAEDIAKLMQALVSRLPVPPAGAAAAPAGPSTILEGAVTITSDKATNSLIIVGSPGDFEIMKDVIQKLDIRRRQVYVEAAIIEMSLDKQRELGLEFQVPVKSSSLVENATSASAIGGTNFGNIGNAIANGPAALAGSSGLTVGAIRGTFQFQGRQFLSIGALLHALQADSNVNVLSTPNILTMDNQKAEIMVGQNVPFLTGQTQSAATAGQIFTQVTRQDVGITLKLTPQITSDDNVRLEVYQEISDVVPVSGAAAVNGPTTNKRSASTTVVVKDSQTMVIGGLIRDNVTSAESKVPFLGDIPLLGWLFKSKTTRMEKTNLMIFITPYIIKTEGDATELTNRKSEKLEEFRKEYKIEKKNVGPTFGPKTGAPPPSAPAETKPASEPSVELPAPPEMEPAPGPNVEPSAPPAQPPMEPVPPQEGVR